MVEVEAVFLFLFFLSNAGKNVNKTAMEVQKAVTAVKCFGPETIPVFSPDPGGLSDHRQAISYKSVQSKIPPSPSSPPPPHTHTHKKNKKKTAATPCPLPDPPKIPRKVTPLGNWPVDKTFHRS